MVERRQPPHILQITALLISAAGLILGPCFGAGVAVIGTYVSMQSKSAVSDAKFDTLSGKVDALSGKVDSLTDKVGDGKNSSTELKTKMESESKRIDQIFTKIGELEAHDSKQESQNSELLGTIRAKK